MWAKRSLVPALALFTICALASVTKAEESVIRSIRVTTEPAGADICEIVEGKLSCLGRTPSVLQLEFRSAVSTKRLHLLRVAYKTAQVIVKPTDLEVACRLEPRDIYAEITPPLPIKHKEVLAFINDKIRNLFFGSQPTKGLRGFEFLGRINVEAADEDKFSVIIPIMIEDNFRIKEISRIDREYQGEKRATAIADSLWKGYAEPLASTLFNAFANEKRIERIIVLASYSRTAFTLVDEDYAFIATAEIWVGSYTTGSGANRRRVDEYQIRNFSVPYEYTTIAASKKVYTAVYIISTTNLADRAAKKLGLDHVTLLSNDNRTNKFLEIER